MSDYSDLILADGAFAYWRLGESSGTTADNAEGTAAYDGTYVGSPTLGVAGAILGDSDTAVTLDGATQYVTCGALGTFGSNIDAGISIEVTFRSSYSGAHQALFDGEDGGIGDTRLQLFLRSSDGRPQLSVLDDNSLSNTNRRGDSSNLLDGEWHHLVVTVDGGADAPVFYVDGEQVSTTVISGAAQSGGYGNFTKSRIGVATDGTRFFNGTIDDVSIFDSVLSADQALIHYRTGITGFPRIGLPAIHTGIAARMFPNQDFGGIPKPMRDAYVMAMLRGRYKVGGGLPPQLLMGRMVA